MAHLRNINALVEIQNLKSIKNNGIFFFYLIEGVDLAANYARYPRAQNS